MGWDRKVRRPFRFPARGAGCHGAGKQSSGGFSVIGRGRMGVLDWVLAAPQVAEWWFMFLRGRGRRMPRKRALRGCVFGKAGGRGASLFGVGALFGSSSGRLGDAGVRGVVSCKWAFGPRPSGLCRGGASQTVFRCFARVTGILSGLFEGDGIGGLRPCGARDPRSGLTRGGSRGGGFRAGCRGRGGNGGGSPSGQR